MMMAMCVVSTHTRKTWLGSTISHVCYVHVLALLQFGCMWPKYNYMFTTVQGCMYMYIVCVHAGAVYVYYTHNAINHIHMHVCTCNIPATCTLLDWRFTMAKLRWVFFESLFCVWMVAVIWTVCIEWGLLAVPSLPSWATHRLSPLDLPPLSLYPR